MDPTHPNNESLITMTHSVEVYNTGTGAISRTVRVSTENLSGYAKGLRPSEYMIVRAATVERMAV